MTIHVGELLEVLIIDTLDNSVFELQTNPIPTVEAGDLVILLETEVPQEDYPNREKFVRVLAANGVGWIYRSRLRERP